jgi:RNA polymerase sigma-70 factor (ECF subfamily)
MWKDEKNASPASPATENEINKQLQQWVNLYAADLYRRAYYLTSQRETAEDLVQETFLAATQQFRQFSGKSSPKTWLLGILNHKVADYFRLRFRQRPAQETELSANDTYFTESGAWRIEAWPSEWDDTPDNLLDIPEFGRVFEECLEHLPATWHDVLLLKFIEAKKSDEICQGLGLSTTNYWQIIHRAKLQMRHCLEQLWFQRR